MSYQTECYDIIMESRGVSLSYYLACILNDLYKYYQKKGKTLKIGKKELDKFDFIYQHLISNVGKQKYNLLNAKRIYCINFLLSEYQYYLTNRVQFKYVKHYLKLTIDNYNGYKKILTNIHSGVKTINNIYNQTQNEDAFSNFETIRVPPLFYRPKPNIQLCNILCCFQCMETKCINITPILLKNTLHNNIKFSINIFDMCITPENIELVENTINVSDEEGCVIDSLIDEEEEELIVEEFYINAEELEYISPHEEGEENELILDLEESSNEFGLEELSDD
jgi:hypothetical protein